MNGGRRPNQGGTTFNIDIKDKTPRDRRGSSRGFLNKDELNAALHRGDSDGDASWSEWEHGVGAARFAAPLARDASVPPRAAQHDGRAAEAAEAAAGWQGRRRRRQGRWR